MDDQYGSDFITITDDDGNDYELEVLSSIEYNGNTYLAVTLADPQDAESLDVSILKSTEENGEPILSAVEDDQELETVYSLIMDALYDEDDE